MGCVEAWDKKSNEMIWRRQIYVVKYTVGLERDVQDVFITTLKLKGNTFETLKHTITIDPSGLPAQVSIKPDTRELPLELRAGGGAS